MAAAYAALLSLSQVLNQILHPPPAHKTIVVREQIELLLEKVGFVIAFLENYPGEEIGDLGTQIAYAAYESEDFIESNMFDEMLERRTRIDHREKVSLLSEGVRRVIEKFVSIERELAEKIEDKKGVAKFEATSSSRPPLPIGNNTMVGFEDRVNEIMSALSTDESSRRVISIVGMGGIGKTTLAKNVYNNPFIVDRFCFRAWVTISQEYTKKDILVSIWSQIGNRRLKEDEKRDDTLVGELVRKELFGRKYLIVMDDMWDIEAWDMVNRFLPDNDNGSRILVTTRLSNLAVDFGYSSPHKMEFLDEKESWDLLREKVFGKEDVCPLELEKIGKHIARRCRGLPLALVVIGGLLAKSERTREHWVHIAERVTSEVNYENNEYFIKILSLSYSHLPMYLKPCFLYLSVFPEDFEIRVTMLVRLWVAEGFIKPVSDKSLEQIAEEYLEDLMDRNLVLVRKRGSSGKVKTCSIHDLLRDMCTREAQKDKFMYIPQLHDPNISPFIESERRLCIHSGPWKHKVFETSKSAFSKSAGIIRSLLVYSVSNSTSDIASSLRLVRILHMVRGNVKAETPPLFNLRYLACNMDSEFLLSFVSRLWNLQSLIVDINIALPAKIWQMPRLRHLKMKGISLRDPPDSQNTLVLENLQTLSTVHDFKCTEQATRRIPNLKKLGIRYTTKKIGSYCLDSLVGFRKLESLVLEFTAAGVCTNIAFPRSLKKLSLSGSLIPWEDMSIVGSLPNLQVLKLKYNAAKGEKWNPIEGEFGGLKFLLIDNGELVTWEADNTHFPSLEHLILGQVSLKEIPIDFAEIANLQVIQLLDYGGSLWKSAEEISEQRESLGYEPIQIRQFISSMKKVVFLVKFANEKVKTRAMKKVSTFSGMDSISFDPKDSKLTVIGYIDPVLVIIELRKICHTEIVSVGPVKEQYFYGYRYHDYQLSEDTEGCVIC
ncbi:hypothetical protein ACP275_04G129500 [Erythranthe tilingii]